MARETLTDALAGAIQYGEVDKVKALVRKPGVSRLPPEAKAELLARAAARDLPVLVTTLHAAGFPVHPPRGMAQPLARAVESPKMIALLLKLGANPNAVDGHGEDPLARAAFEVQNRIDFGASVGQLRAFTRVTNLLLAAGAKPKAKTRRQLERLQQYIDVRERGVRDVATPDSAREPDWAKRVRSHLVKLGSSNDARDRVEPLARKVLSQPFAVSHPEWPKLVRELIACSERYVDVSEDVYDERVKYADDHVGPLKEEWLGGLYTTLPVVFSSVLASEAACAHPAWFELVRHALEVRKKYDFDPTRHIRKLFALPHVKRHPRYDELVNLAAKTRPTLV